MTKDPNGFQESSEINRSIDINKVIQIIISRWYIIVGALLLSLSIAYLQLRYTKPMYSAHLSLKFDDDRGSQVTDLFRYGRLSGRIENILKTESEVMKSRSMAMKTLDYMKMYTSAYIEGNIVTSLLYPNTYFHVDFIRLDSSDLGRSFLVRFKNEFEYELLKDKDSKNGQKHLVSDTLRIGNSLVAIRVLDPEMIMAIDNQAVHIVINDLLHTAMSYASGLNIEIEKNTNIIDISYISDVPELAADYVNALSDVYIQESVNVKAKAAEQTVKYINDQLIDLSLRVKETQSELASFKSANKGIQPTEMGRVEFDRLINFETQKNILILRKKQLEVLERNISTAKNKVVELVAFDVEEARSLSELFSLLNSLILDRISMSSRNKPESPVMLENDRKITEVKSALVRTIRSLRSSLDSKIANNQAQIDQLEGILKGIPSKEQALLNLERNFKINEKIYGYLQEKKLESSIGMSSITSNASVIDAALVSYAPISPKPGRNYLVAILIGVGIGVSFIFLTRLLYNKIPDKETIESVSLVPVIGVIKKLNIEAPEEGDYSIHTLQNPKSIFSESIRGIRTNMNFLLKGEQHRLICVTSTVSGEGKTFCTINLAASMTLLGYKVVIVGCDLRRPKLHLSFKSVSNSIGLSTYLVNKSTYEEVVFTTEFENLFVVPAGPTPPNPAELLQTTDFENFIDRLKNTFDYVFFDTAPVGLVSDSFPLLAKADVNLFIIRAQYSKRDFATIPDRLKSDNKIKNIYSILNSFDSSSITYSSIYRTEYGGYYGGGGYYYYGGYYSRGGYGYYGRNYNSSYYSGYYSDDEMNPPGFFTRLFKKIFRKK